MNLNQAQRVLVRTHLSALASGHRASAVELQSGPGIGKSSIIGQSAAELAVELNEPVGLVIFMLATISSVDVRGFMMPAKRADGLPGMDTYFSTPPWYPTNPNLRVYMPDGTVHGMGTWTGPLPRVGLLGLDEFGQAEDEVKKAAAELLLHGEVGTTVLPPGWRVVAASNRLTDRSGVMRPLMFLVNRRMEIAIDADAPTWIAWANAQQAPYQPHYLTISFAEKQPHLVFRDAVPAGAAPFCTPRTLCLMDRDLMALRSADDIARNRLPIDPIAREVAAGWIGGGEAAQYFTHLKYANELPDIGEIERNPLTAKLPTNKDAQMVAGYMLAHNVNEKNGKNILHYIERLNIEMQVLAVNAIQAKPKTAKHMLNTIGFSQWLQKNKDLIIASNA